MNAKQAWQSVLGQLQMEMPKASFDTWVRDTYPLSYENGVLTVGVSNAYARDWLDSRLASTVSRLLVGVLNANVAVSFVVSPGEETETVESEAALEARDNADRSLTRNISLNPRYTFETFVVGSGNRLAHAACQAVAEKPARAYNPLFLYHRLHAAGHRVQRSREA